MNSRPFKIDEIDKEFVAEILMILYHKYGVDEKYIQNQRYLFKRMLEDPEYFYHHDEVYWAEVLFNKYYAATIEYSR